MYYSIPVLPNIVLSLSVLRQTGGTKLIRWWNYHLWSLFPGGLWRRDGAEEAQREAGLQELQVVSG